MIDINVIVSSILSRKGSPAELLNAWLEQHFLLLSSPEIVTEVQAVVLYPCIRDKYHLCEDEQEQTITLLEHDAILVVGDANVAGSVLDDPKDEMFLACVFH